MIGFAFKTQVFDKSIWQQVSFLIENSQKDMLPILGQLQQQESSYQPLKIKFTVKSQAIKDKIKAVKDKAPGFIMQS